MAKLNPLFAKFLDQEFLMNMNHQPVSPNPYTHKPPLHSNPIWGSVQLIIWLFFHPSAWQNHIQSIDPTLSPLFCWAELSQSQKDQPAMQRLWLMAYVVCPLLVALVLLLLLPVISADKIVYGMAVGVTSSMVLSMGLSMRVSLALGISVGVVGGIGVGLLKNIFFAWNLYLYHFSAGIVIGVALGTALIMIHRTTKQDVTYSITKPNNRLMVGILIGSMMISVALITIVNTLNGGGRNIVASGLAGSALFLLGMMVGPRWHTSAWHQRVLFNAISGILFGLGVGFIHFLLSAGTKDEILALLADFELHYSTIEWLYDQGLWFLKQELTTGILSGVDTAALFIFLFAVPYLLAREGADLSKSARAGMLGSSLFYFVFFFSQGFISGLALLAGVLIGIPLSQFLLRFFYPVFVLWNMMLVELDKADLPELPTLLRFHSAFWDEHQNWPLINLERHLLLVASRHPEEGQKAVDFLINSLQHWAVRTELDVRQLEYCDNVQQISRVHHLLASNELVKSPLSSLLHRMSNLSYDIESAFNQTTTHLRHSSLTNILHQLSSLSQELTPPPKRHSVLAEKMPDFKWSPSGSGLSWAIIILLKLNQRLKSLLSSPIQDDHAHAARFHPIVQRWHAIVAQYRAELTEVEMVSPYILGLALQERAQIFTGRRDVSARVEQLLLDPHRPALLLYGQKRIGKTSFLLNLGQLLPSAIVPLYVDGEFIASASDIADLLYSMVRKMRKWAEQWRGLLLPPLTRKTLTANPFTRFDEWLDEVESALHAQGCEKILLALDEFESLVRAAHRGRFDEEDFLNILRHLIQHRSSFQVLLVASHTLEELNQWADHLNNVQVLKISYLQEDEARQLIERPVSNFALAYDPAASQRVLALTRGHPALLQGLCHEIVRLKNKQPATQRHLVTVADVEMAIPQALTTGSFIYKSIVQQALESELTLLRFLSKQGEEGVVSRKLFLNTFPHHLPHELERNLTLLLRRDLIEQVEHGYRFQVELIRRFVERMMTTY